MIRSMWWLSFCDPEGSEGSQFLGVAIVPGLDVVDAASTAHRFGCNPGGEVAGAPVPWDVERLIDSSRWCHRLLTRAEAESLDDEIERRLEETS